MNKKNKSRAISLIKKLVVRPARNNQETRTIQSVGTQRNYVDCIKLYLDWCDWNEVTDGLRGSKVWLMIYLDEKSEVYQQKTLDQHRMALNAGYHKKLPFVKSLLSTIQNAREYRLVEALTIIKNLQPKNAIAILLCYYSGLRAHELATIRRLDEGKLTQTRKWSENIFSCEENCQIYLVTGKGGLCRQISVPIELSIILEQRRFEHPQKVRDREIYYNMNYDMGYGKALSQCFSRASKKYFKYSTGLHGLRHSYAKNRLKKLICNGFSLENAKLIVSQELGHFRPEITNCYLR